MKLFYVTILLAACFQTAYSLRCYSGKSYKLKNEMLRSVVSTVSTLRNMTGFGQTTCGSQYNSCGSALYNRTLPVVGKVRIALAMCFNDALGCTINCDGESDCQTVCCKDRDLCNEMPVEFMSSASYTKSFIVMVVALAVFSVCAY